MSTTVWPTYDEMVSRLNLDKVQATASRIREGLEHSTVAVSYQPGDGTAYDLVITPCHQLHQVAEAQPYEASVPSILAGGWRVPTGIGLHSGGPRLGWHVVSKVNGETWAYPFDFTPGGWVPTASYISGHTDGNFATGCALCALFRAIAGDPILDGDRH